MRSGWHWVVMGACAGLALLVAGCERPALGAAAPAVAAAGSPQEVVTPPVQVAELEQRVAVLEQAVATLQARPVAPAPAAPQPIPTLMPPVQGLQFDGTLKGLASAPITITEYADFQCPFCARYALSVGRQIDEAYIKTGKASLVFRNRAFLGPESTWAAEAALCAADQGKFWQYHDKLYERWAGENQGAFARDKLKGFAADLGLDTQAFGTCLDADKYAQRVKDETAASERAGVTGTPTFFIGKVQVIGAQPFEAFKAAIESQAH